MSRHTFVIQVYGEGPATLENLDTRERVPVSDLAAVGPQIERWLATSAAREEGMAGERHRLDTGSAPNGDRAEADC